MKPVDVSAANRVEEMERDMHRRLRAMHAVVRADDATGFLIREVAEAHVATAMLLEQMTRVAGLIPGANAEPSCGFCGADRTRAKVLLAGPRAFICETCAETAHDVAEWQMEQQRSGAEGGE